MLMKFRKIILRIYIDEIFPELDLYQGDQEHKQLLIFLYPTEKGPYNNAILIMVNNKEAGLQ